mmetsp:Transcript_15835/g.20929  ORF Transcript_15835/g.20929 Transcript_15835/m.20929 type:complete len:569 (-) Transcript_15835:219-1925(-)
MAASYYSKVGLAILFGLGLLSLQAFAFTNSPRLRLTPKYHPLVRHATTQRDSTVDVSAQVLDKLSTIIDPDLHQDIVSLGFIKELEIDAEKGLVSFNVELTTPACPIKEQFKEDCLKNVQELGWVKDVQVTMTAQEPKGSPFEGATGMSQVSNVIAVSSCKGGVGKSTTAVNLAFTLAKQGARVGILDADIYGPSLPIMVKPESEHVEFIENQIKPLERDGVKLMSFGYVNPTTAIMRGAMVTQLIQQFVLLTSWGELDYLVVDMPPGTGDIQLTLTQILNITASVIVTTPQKLSFEDVVKGIDMFDTVNVPSVAVVENMAFYEVPNVPVALESSKSSVADIIAMSEDQVKASLAELGLQAEGSVEEQKTQLISHQIQAAINVNTEQRQIFGAGHRRKLKEMWGIEHTYSMPLTENLAKQGDLGTPFVLQYPDAIQTQNYETLAATVVQEVAKLKYGKKPAPEIGFITEDGKKFININNGEQKVLTKTLRAKCRCAACVEEFTGVQIVKEEDISENIEPLEIQGIGNYATAITWSDGHKSLYPYKSFVNSFQNTKKSPFSKNRQMPDN